MKPTDPIDRRSFIRRKVAFIAALWAMGLPRSGGAGTLVTDPYIGQIALFPFGFAPQGWTQCNGQILPIQHHSTLFSLIGNAYGGDGLSTFALPDLRGRSPLHWGQGPGLTSRSRGGQGGEVAHALTLDELPSHTHTVRASSLDGTSPSPAGMYPARSAAGVPRFAEAADAVMAPTISIVGGGQAHPNMQPFLTLNYCICIIGISPPP